MNNYPDEPSNNEEEFKFGEEESAEQYNSSASSASVVSATRDDEKARRKKLIIIIVGAIIALFCIYKLYDLFTASPSKVPINPQKQSAAMVSTTSQAPSLPAPAVLSTAEPDQAKPVVVEDKAQLSDKISQLEQAVSQNGQAQENLQNQISGLSSAISEIQNNISMLSQQMGALSQQLNKPAEKPKTVAEPVKKVKKPAPRAVVHPTIYYVKALIQGRAWLMSSEGATFTISVGDSLPGYGTIQTIDPDKGIVTTSSGREISFRAQDK